MDIIVGAAVIAAAIVVAAALYLFRPAGGGVSPESFGNLQGTVQTIAGQISGLTESVNAQIAGLTQTVNAQVTGLTSTVNTQIGAANTQMFEQLRTQFAESQRLATDIRDQVRGQLTQVATQVGQTQEATRKVFTIADQLQDLQRVLTSQKQRGNLGEAGLTLILQNILAPTDYRLQYKFANGEAVDAAIMAPEGIIPVDAKFTLDNYARIVNEPDPDRRAELEKVFATDVKDRIDETAKYIRPSEGTVDFAFMFIPAEAIYYDLLVNEVGAVKSNTRTLIEYAFRERKVVIVSPTTFAAYLQTVLQGFRAFKIERDAREIAKNVEHLGRHLKAYEEFFSKLGSSLQTTVNHYNAAGRELGKIDKDVLRITGAGAGLAAEEVERPLLTAE